MNFTESVLQRKKIIALNLLKVILLSVACFTISACAIFMPREVIELEKHNEEEAAKFNKENPEQSKFIEMNGLRLHFVETFNDSKKPTILFVHGSPGSWKGWARYLNDPDLRKNANMMAVDRPGFGESNRGLVERSLKKQAEMIASLIGRKNSNEKIILVGHSFGGPIVSRMAMDFPDKISDIVILAGDLDPNLETTQWYQYPADWFLFSWLIPLDLVVANREIMAAKPQLEEMLPGWNRITQGVTLIQGTDDDLVPSGNADFAESKIKNSHALKILRVPKMNHFIPWSRYELVKKELLEIISRNDAHL